MDRAKSRLHSTPSHRERHTPASHDTKKIAIHPTKYLMHLPMLLLSLPFYAGAGYMLTNVQPSAIRHWLLPNSYVPLLLTLLVANTFLFGFMFLNIRRGLLVSLFITALLFFKVQSVMIDMGLIFIVLISFGIIELILTGLTKRHANIR